MSQLQLLLGRAGVRIGSVFNYGQLKTASDVAKEFGLRDIGNSWKEVPQDKAKRILRALLKTDLAYDSDTDTSDIADEVTTDFFSWFSEDARYYTNSEWRSEDDFSSRSIGSWTPATNATFDSGILVLGTQSGIYWIEDED